MAGGTGLTVTAGAEAGRSRSLPMALAGYGQIPAAVAHFGKQREYGAVLQARKQRQATKARFNSGVVRRALRGAPGVGMLRDSAAHGPCTGLALAAFMRDFKGGAFAFALVAACQCTVKRLARSMVRRRLICGC